MDEAAELANYLPLSFKCPKDQEFIETYPLGRHRILKKKSDLAEFWLLHLGTDPSSWAQDSNLGMNNLGRYVLR